MTSNMDENVQSVASNASLREAVIQKLQDELEKGEADKLRRLENLKTQLLNEKSKIEKCLILSGNNVPTKISKAIKKAEDASERIKTISKAYTRLNKSAINYQKKVLLVKNDTTPFVDKIDRMEKTCRYLRLIQEIEAISNNIEAGINDKNERKQVINYLLLNDLIKFRQDTKCKHLMLFLNETVHYWHNILKERFIADYDEVLSAMKWPFVSNNVLILKFSTIENMNRFQTLTEYLIQIQIDQHELVTSSFETDFPPITLPMSQMIKPLRKRFLFHFMGSRQTNRADKPEWFFTQVLTWIKDHQDFVEKNVQPIYDKLLQSNAIAKIEFMRGLVQLVVEKLHTDLPHLYYDDALFSHCVDEALGFNKELKLSYWYPDSEPGVIEVLTQAQIFVKWINMEKRYSLEKMDKILISETAFDVHLGEEGDEFRITECGYGFITLLSSITERYEVLPRPGHKLQFLQLQLDLIDDFRVRLLQMLQGEDIEPLISKFPNILNTVDYVKAILEEWGHNTFFLGLQFFKVKPEKNDEIEAAGTVFDDCINILIKMKDTLIEDLVDHIFMEVKAKSMAYRRDKWHAMESPKDCISPAIRPTACEMFQILINRLHQLREFLADKLFKQSWSLLATKLDQFFYEEIVALCLFNEGGALQFTFDITKNLFPLFGQYSNKPETHFKLLKDSCTVLSMTKGVALLLRNTIKGSEGEESYSTEILNDVGVYTLRKEDVLDILSRRTDFC